MTSTRVTTIVTFLLATTGLSFLVLGESPALVVAGAASTVGAATYLTRHFWREAGKKSERLARASTTTLEREMAETTSEIGAATDSLRGEITAVSQRVDAFSRGVLEYVAQLELDTAALRNEVDQIPERMKKGLELNDHRAQRYREELLAQVSGVIAVYQVLEPKIPYPPFGGWAIDGECARRFVGRILTDRPHVVVEMGSGLSTVLAAHSMRLAGIDGSVISLEHDERWVEETRELTRQHDVSDRCQVVHAPLVETTIDGETFAWYDLSRAELPDHVQLVLVDGPPKATGPKARYPAIPMLYERLDVGSVVILDDAARPDERQILDMWAEKYSTLSVSFKGGPKGIAEITRLEE